MSIYTKYGIGEAATAADHVVILQEHVICEAAIAAEHVIFLFYCIMYLCKRVFHDLMYGCKCVGKRTYAGEYTFIQKIDLSRNKLSLKIML